MISKKELTLRYIKAANQRDERAPLLRELASNLLPRQSNFYTEQWSGRNPYRHLYSNAGIINIRNLTDRTIRSLMPKGGSWATIEMTPLFKQNLDDQQRHVFEVALDKATMIFMSHLNKSNLRKKIRSAAQMYYAFGQATVMPTLKHGLLDFQVLSTDRLMVEERTDGDDGGGIFWSRNMTRRDIRMMFGEEMGGKDEDTAEIVYCFLKNERGRIEQIAFNTQQTAVWRNYNTTPNSGRSVHKILLQYEYPPDRFPVITGRQDEMAGEAWGIGEGHMILPEVQYANKIRGDALKILALNANPIFAVGHGIEPGESGIRPGEVVQTSMPAVGGSHGMPVAPIAVGGNPQVALQAVEESIQRIKETSNEVPKTFEISNVRTATEWNLQKEQMENSTEAVVDEFGETLLTPVLVEAFKILQQDVGLFPPDLSVDGISFNIHVSSHSERARKMTDTTNKRALMEMKAFTDPRVFAGTINESKILREIAANIDQSGAVLSPEQTQMAIQQMQQSEQEDVQQ